MSPRRPQAGEPTNVIPFKGRWHGGVEPSACVGTPQARALHDARAITAAKQENDDWTARLLLALLQTLDRRHLDLLEFRLLGQDLASKSAVQALALVQLANGDKGHRTQVSVAIDTLDRRRVR